MSAPSLLSAATVVSRSASALVPKAVRAFQVLRIDGYSLTKMIPGGENISNSFVVGNRVWQVDYYPNGADRSKDSDYISLYLRLLSRSGGYNYNYNYDKDFERVQAQYKFCLLDAAGNPAYEHPAQTSIFTCSRHPEKDLQGLGCGHGEFISREELERRRESLLKDDCLAIRCDVGFVELEQLHLGQKYSNTAHHDPHDWSDSDYESDDEKPRRRRNRRQPDDNEFIRRCLAEHRRRK